MTRTSSIFVGSIALIGAFLLFLFGIATITPLTDNAVESTPVTKTLTPTDIPTVRFGNPIRGNPTAKVTIVEFGDYLCEPCATMEPIFAKILKEFAPDVRLVWKDFPNTTLHKDAAKAANAARCAQEQGLFWEYHDALFEHQESINEQSLIALAGTIPLDQSAFQKCMDTALTSPIVERDFEEGVRLGLDGTPYMFINERRVSGEVDESQMRTLVQTALDQTKQPRTPIKR